MHRLQHTDLNPFFASGLVQSPADLNPKPQNPYMQQTGNTPAVSFVKSARRPVMLEHFEKLCLRYVQEVLWMGRVILRFRAAGV